jgi:sec-independent protein translocase protein TatA
MVQGGILVTMLAWMPGPFEIAVIGVIALLLFGRRLPEVGRSLGKGITEFKKGLNDVGESAAAPPPEEKKPDTSADEVAKLKAEIERLKANKSSSPPAAQN